MNEKIELAKPIDIKDNSKTRVAYDLAMVIANNEVESNLKNNNPRKYYLELYELCLKACEGRHLPNDL